MYRQCEICDRNFYDKDYNRSDISICEECLKLDSREYWEKMIKLRNESLD
jgi:hypothetical protein